MSFLRLLRDRWRWWAIPLALMLALTFALAWLGRGNAVAPFRYDATGAR